MEKKVENNSHESIFASLCEKVVIKDLSPSEFVSAWSRKAFDGKWDWYDKVNETVRYIGFSYPNVTYLNAEGMYECLSRFDYVYTAQLFNQSIKAVVVEEFNDATALAVAIKSHPEQLPFKKWAYLQRIRFAKICNQFIRNNAMQGKRTDLQASSTCVHLDENASGAKSTCVHNDDYVQGTDFTCVHSETMLATRTKRPNIRDVIAKHIGISSTNFEGFRCIARLDDEVIEIIGKSLDEKRLDFVAAYDIARLKHEEQNVVINLMRNDAEIALRSKAINPLYIKSKKSKKALTECKIMEMLNL